MGLKQIGFTFLIHTCNIYVVVILYDLIKNKVVV